MKTPVLSLVLLFTAIASFGAVRFERVPDGGIQPRVVVGPEGKVHLLYFKGEAMGGNVFYATRGAGLEEFSMGIQVNKKSGSAMAAGTMRGPQFAVGKGGRAHVVWMGGNGAEKVEVGGMKTTPLLYARMADTKDRFEPERNILTHIGGLDGGQSIASDQQGTIYVVWHGSQPGVENEEERGLYVARSDNEGRTFSREEQADVPRKGSCACCGVRAKVDESGALHVLFRAAERGVNRPELWLKSMNGGASFEILHADLWKTATCPASSADFDFRGKWFAGAWETDNRVAALVRNEGRNIELKPTAGAKQKHPAVAVNAKGETLLAWVEDAGWGTSGTLVCQVFDASGVPVGEAIRKRYLPGWSFGAAYVDERGDFVVLY